MRSLFRWLYRLIRPEPKPQILQFPRLVIDPPYAPRPSPEELDAAGLADWDMDDVITLGPRTPPVPIRVYTLAIDGALVPDEEPVLVAG